MAFRRDHIRRGIKRDDTQLVTGTSMTGTSTRAQQRRGVDVEHSGEPKTVPIPVSEGVSEPGSGAGQDHRADVHRPDGEPEGDQPADTGRSKDTKEKKKGSFWKELPILIVVALVLTFLIQTFLARVYIIPSGSMEKTLHGCTGCTGDRILVDKVVFDFRDPEPGDVVVFRGPNGWARSEFQVDSSDNAVVHWLKEFGAAIGLGPPQEYDLVKRVIAVGGQTISCCTDKHRVMVDGKPLDEPYIYWMPSAGGPNAPNQEFAPVKVPKNTIFVMGDSRNNSFDSRFQNGGGVNGVVPLDNVIGKARTIIWPPKRWGGVTDHDPQQTAMSAPLNAPGWQSGVPAGIGLAAAWPTLWLSRKTGRLVHRTGSRLRRRR
ncbi:MAG: signal peptidase I [Sciscionella sp.]